MDKKLIIIAVTVFILSGCSYDRERCRGEAEIGSVGMQIIANAKGK